MQNKKTIFENCEYEVNGQYKVHKPNNQTTYLFFDLDLREENRSTISEVAIESELDNYKLREYMVKKYIHSLLEIIINSNLKIDPLNQIIIETWKEYVLNFSEKRDLDIAIKKEDLYKLLVEKKDLFLDILQNNSKKYLLLQEEISPIKLGLGSGDIKKLISVMLRNILEENKTRFSLAIIGEDLEYTAQYIGKQINSKLKDANTIVPENTIDYKEFIKILPLEKIQYFELDEIEQYDYILSINNLHQFKNLEDIVKKVKLLLKPGASWHIIDYSEMDSLSVLLAIFFQKEYIGIDNETRKEFFYKKNYVNKLINSYLPTTLVYYTEKSYYYKFTKEKSIYPLIDKLTKNYGNSCDEIYLATKEDSLNEDLLDDFISQAEYKYTNKKSLTNIEKQEILEDIWMNNLRTNSISMDADYFREGGDSLSATRLILDIENRLDYKLTLKGVFENPIFRDLLNRIILSKEDAEIIEGEI